MKIPNNLNFEDSIKGMGKHIIFDHLHGALGVKVLLFDMIVPPIMVKEMEDLGWKYVYRDLGDDTLPLIVFVREELEEDTLDLEALGQDNSLYFIPFGQVLSIRQNQMLKLHQSHTKIRGNNETV